MDTYEARVATFSSGTVGSTRRRASNAKGSKALAWPHKTPTPADLALAGFYFKPSTASPDNTVCFMCDRKLDGWEAEDDPFSEHLKHSGNCAWALVTCPYIEGEDEAVSEDPTTSKMMDARRETFAGKWPHEGKRGWVCKTEKMVEAGWHYAPMPESDDSVSCAYCKLSLDGWEPKDNPFDEHYRRSPDCRYFTFAGTTAPKAGRGKKGRTSKAARLSTQSNITAVSEAPSIPDFEDSIDQTIMSQDTVLSTAPKATTKGGKSGKGRAKVAKARKPEPAAIEESSVLETPDELQPSKTKRGKKRTSEQMSGDEARRGERESTVRPEPPPKRRATRTRVSSAQSVQYPTLSLDEPTGEEPSQPVRGGRKRASSRARKVSTASTASKASLRARIPDDSAIEAELAAELDIPLSDEDIDMKDTSVAAPEPISKPKGRKTKATASTAPIRQPQVELEEHLDGKDEGMQIDESNLEQNESRSKKKGKTTKGRGKKIAITKTEEDVDAEIQDASEMILSAAGPSAIGGPTATKPDDEDADTEMTEAPKAKKCGRKKAGTRSKAQKKHEGPVGEPADDVEEAITETQREPNSVKELVDSLPQPPLCKEEHGQGISKEPEPEVSMPGAFDAEDELKIQPSSPILARQTTNEQEAKDAVENRIESARQAATPSPSPQPSDVENQPPSSRPSASRPPLLSVSPSKTQTKRVPVVTTPKQSPSKLNRPISALTTSYPWTSVDVDLISSQMPSETGKENIPTGLNEVLTSPEKRMSVEEWVSAMAKKAEQQFKDETERVVGIFEKEGSRAMRVLEGIECVD